ncbi:hypothetical protein HET69_33115 [Streptomyces sp. CJ_13]|uniref:hypothetical protein n=1 Tax=Streptomyces sp. CJ_13 TaxID=2724943 RepID=UPI001BDDAE29|nr:hypothetical protein [Streptomyces sp. CJ_13]MBT1188695.1 hypothetical protein [Streptomyces sp. CJ_13]
MLVRARYWQRPAIAALFDVPLETVEERNATRARSMPGRDHHQLLHTPDELLAEGFIAVHRISDLGAAGAPQ